MVQETVQNHRRWSYQDGNSVKGQKGGSDLQSAPGDLSAGNRGEEMPHPPQPQAFPPPSAWSPWSQIHPGSHRTKEPRSSPDSPGPGSFALAIPEACSSQLPLVKQLGMAMVREENSFRC